MIQRIQTVFLALAAIGEFSLFGVPFASTPEEVVANEIFADRLYTLTDHIGLLLFFPLAGLLAVVSIFMYQKRRLQMRLTIFSIIALIIGIAFGAIYFINNSGGLDAVAVNDRLGVFLPVISLILSLLAYRYIQKDEQLVRSMDRLR